LPSRLNIGRADRNSDLPASLVGPGGGDGPSGASRRPLGGCRVASLANLPLQGIRLPGPDRRGRVPVPRRRCRVRGTEAGGPGTKSPGSWPGRVDTGTAAGGGCFGRTWPPRPLERHRGRPELVRLEERPENATISASPAPRHGSGVDPLRAAVLLVLRGGGQSDESPVLHPPHHAGSGSFPWIRARRRPRLAGLTHDRTLL